MLRCESVKSEESKHWCLLVHDCAGAPKVFAPGQGNQRLPGWELMLQWLPMTTEQCVQDTEVTLPHVSHGSITGSYSCMNFLLMTS